MKFSYPSGSKPLEGYTIKRGIGIGGFGEVYFALSDAGKEVALKKIQRNLDIELRGVRQCLNLKHVNLISLWDIKVNEYGESWVVMEYVPGPSLRDTVEANPNGMPEDEIKTWFSSTASGVAYLHEQGIVHRDLKPGNIFCDSDEQVIKIGDYGLSKFISCSRRSGQTESVGTFHYMAPEIGKGIYGREIDVYALGILLFEMLTGDVPFDGESSQEIIMKHLTAEPDLSAAPEEFRELIAKSLRKDPELRYDTVQDMVADLPWPEIAAASGNIVSQNSVGPMVVQASKKLTADYPGPNRSQPQTDNETPDQSVPNPSDPKPDNPEPTTTIPAQLPPVIMQGGAVVNSPGINFGELRDSQRQAADVRAVSAGKSDVAEEDPVKVIKHTGNPSGGNNLLMSNSFAASGGSIDAGMEPIAQAVSHGWGNALQWWDNANVSMPIRLGLMAIAGAVVIKNSQWLLPLVLIAGVAYLVYYLARQRVSPSQLDHPTQKQLQRQTMLTVRDWIGKRPGIDRVTELVGSLLIGALSCIVLTLLGFALGGELLGESIEPWARFVWLTATSVLATWALLAFGKFWEHRTGGQLLCRLAMIGIGLAIGAFAFFAAGSCNIDLTRMTAEDFQARQTQQFVFSGIPLFPAYLIFFAVLFGILRWWRQSDPIRRTRMSILSVAVCLVVAAVFSHLLSVPLTGNCILAVVISVSVQLASPWFHPNNREEICAGGPGQPTGVQTKLFV